MTGSPKPGEIYTYTTDALAIASYCHKQRPLVETTTIFDVVLPLVRAGTPPHNVTKAVLDAVVVTRRAVDYQLALIKQQERVVGGAPYHQEFRPPDTEPCPPEITKEKIAGIRRRLSFLRRT